MKGALAVLGTASDVGKSLVATALCRLLADDEWRSAFLNEIRRDRGLPPREVRKADDLEVGIDRWTRHVKGSLRLGAWARVMAVVGR